MRRLVCWLLFLLPLVYMPGFLSYATIRYFVFGTASLALLFLTIKAWMREPWLWRAFVKSPLSWGLAGYLATFLLTSITSAHPALSFFSSFDRTDGFFALLFLSFFAVAIYTLCMMEGKQVVPALMKASVLGACILSIFIMFSNDGLRLMFMNSRGGAMIGNSSLAAAYILWNIFFVFILRKNWFYALLPLLLSPLFISWHSFNIGVARAATLAIMFGISVAVATYIYARRKKLGLVLIAGLLLLPPVAGVLLYKHAFVRQQFIEHVGENRLIFWEAAAKSFVKHPILGRGPGTFSDGFYEFFNPRILETESPNETLVDRAHNVVFQHLSDGGIVLFIGFSIFIASVLIGIKRRYQTDTLTGAILFGALAAWFLQAQFVYDSISSLTMLFMVAGIVAAGERTGARKKGSVNTAVLVVVVLAILALFVYAIALPAVKARKIRAVYTATLPERIGLWDFSGISPMGDRVDVVAALRTILRGYLTADAKESIPGWDEEKKKILLEELDTINAYISQTLERDNYQYILLAFQFLYLRMYVANDFSGEPLRRAEEFLEMGQKLVPLDTRLRDLDLHWRQTEKP